jgi:hypothetical protein
MSEKLNSYLKKYPSVFKGEIVTTVFYTKDNSETIFKWLLKLSVILAIVWASGLILDKVWAAQYMDELRLTKHLRMKPTTTPANLPGFGSLFINSADGNKIYYRFPDGSLSDITGSTTYTFNAPLSAAGTTVSISQSGAATNGYLSSTDWNTFNNKLTSPLTTNGDLLGFTTVPARIPVGASGEILTVDPTAAAGVAWKPVPTAIANHNDLNNIQGGTALEYYHLNQSQHTIATQAASGTLSGYLSTGDWSTFNGKENVLSFSAPLSRLVNAVSVTQSGVATDGYLSSTDWNTFNNKLTSPLTTKGDILAYSTTPIRLPIGTDGYVLTADSTAASGISWTEVASGGSGVFRGTFSGTSITQETEEQTQSHTYTASTTQEFAVGGFGTLASYIDGTRITIVVTDADGILTIPATHGQVVMKSDAELAYGDSITFEYVSEMSKMVEISRSR